MPQMAPSLWLLIYFFMCFMILLFMNKLFFIKKTVHKLEENKKLKVSKNFTWQ
uniref:ATP synthase complex subunit 8 n=1 Tax=Metacrangonyx longipes TaxID=510302 RepID=C6SNN4_9CRUS|nr:ATP synthase F0 subunit 8 [Metacrangonyx longipes]CAQ16857.1 ATP synthase F0 subunit 8 [Metacrangonyx longipes]